MSETVSQIGEFGLIGRLRNMLLREGAAARGLVLGIGDDTASFIPGGGHEVLITCDSMVEGRHYLPGHISFYDLGRRAMDSNISDIGAMGGQPLYALVSLGLRPDTAASDLEEMYRGFLAELNPFGAAIIGGNVTGTQECNFIDITLLGEVPRGKAVRRSGARPGDAILVTGYPGQSAIGLQLLLQKPRMEGLKEHPLVRKYLVPSHRAAAGRAAAMSGSVTAMIDTSDGFLGDLGHICEESGAGAMVDERRLPLNDLMVESCKELQSDPIEYILGSSDDYELIITCAAAHAQEVASVLGEAGVEPVSEVGRITAGGEGIRLLGRDGRERLLQPVGWDHFGKK